MLMSSILVYFVEPGTDITKPLNSPYFRYRFKSNRYDHHLLRHLNIQLFQCEEAHCDEWFFSADKLTTHNQRFHQKTETVNCEGCAQPFPDYVSMRKHTNTCLASIKLRNPHLITGETLSSQNKETEE